MERLKADGWGRHAFLVPGLGYCVIIPVLMWFLSIAAFESTCPVFLAPVQRACELRVAACDGVYHTPLVSCRLPHTTVYVYHPPTGAVFSKLDCSTTKRVPMSNGAVFGKLSTRCFQDRPFWAPVALFQLLWRYRPWKIGPGGG